MTNYQTIEEVSKGYRLPIPAMCKEIPEIYELMKQCWHVNPESRPSIAEILNKLNQIFRKLAPVEEESKLVIETDLTNYYNA